MSREKFLSDLEAGLKSLPTEEKEEAMAYYIEYFEDGDGTPEDIAASLGNPAAIARRIVSEAKVNDLEQMKPSAKKGISAVWAVILAIFAIPIGFPVAIAIAAVVFSLLVALFAVIFSLFVAGIATVIAVVVSFITVIPLFFVNVYSGIALLGTILIALGIGMLILLAAFKLNIIIVNGVAGLAKKITRRNKE